MDEPPSRPPDGEPGPSEGTSAAWIRRLRDDPGADDVWSFLSARYQQRILVHAARVLGPGLRERVDPAEVVNEAWMRVHRTMPDFEYRFRDCLYHHLARQVTWVVQDLGRRALRGDRGLVLDANLDASRFSARAPSPEPGPATQALRRDLLDRIVAALEALPELYRRALVGVYLEDRQIGEVALELGVKPNTLAQQVHRGLKLWRAKVGADLDRML